MLYSPVKKFRFWKARTLKSRGRLAMLATEVLGRVQGLRPHLEKKSAVISDGALTLPTASERARELPAAAHAPLTARAGSLPASLSPGFSSMPGGRTGFEMRFPFSNLIYENHTCLLCEIRS